MKISQLATLYFICLLGIMPVAASAKPYTVSTDGSEVTDQKTGLIWRRCTEGMAWNGSTCTGDADTFTHEAALQHAAAQARSTGIAWRLPNVKELYSLTDKSLNNPAIDSTAFPATPGGWFWTASPVVGYPGKAWDVFFYNGSINSGEVGTSRIVRLVRAGQ